MSIELVHPEGLPVPEAYAQVSVATGTRTVHVAGQVAVDREGALVGAGDLELQAERALLNVATALAAAGAGVADIAKLTVYVIDWSPEKMPAFGAGFGRAAATLGLSAPPPTTLIGVAALPDPAWLVEVEAVAILS